MNGERAAGCEGTRVSRSREETHVLGLLGIVSGVTALVVVFFVCLDLVSTGTKRSRESVTHVTGQPDDVRRPLSATGRRAA